MKTVSTDDLVNSLLQSVTTDSPSANLPVTTDTINANPVTTNATVDSSGSIDSGTTAPSPPSFETTRAPATTAPPLTPTSPSRVNPETVTDDAPLETVTRATNTDDGSDAVLSIGITIGVLVLVIAALFFLRSQRNRSQQKKRRSVSSPPAGMTSLTVPAHRGFKKEQELGMPEMSIELSPGDLGLSKGFDVSYASSTRTSTASNQFGTSNASSTDSSVFNTRGGLSPTFSNRKMNNYSYHYRDSEENGNANSTMFHLTGLIGNGQASGRGGNGPASGRGGNFTLSRGGAVSRKLSAPDEYAELVTATNAHDNMEMDRPNESRQVHADFTQSALSQNEMDISMGPDDNHSFLAPLPTRVVPPRTRRTVVRASEESMGPDSPVEKMSSLLRGSEVDGLHTMSAVSFMTESSLSSASTRDSAATTARGSAYMSSMPLLQQLSSADSSDYSQDNSSNRTSMESSDSTNTVRPGSLIALNLEAKEGTSEIAI